MSGVFIEVSADVVQSRQVSDAFRACSRVVDIVNVLLPEAAESQAAFELRNHIAAQLNALTLQDGTGFAAGVARAQADLQQLEKQLEAIDRQMTMRWFRENFDPSQSSAVALVDYATLLGRHVHDSTPRLDRIQFLLTRAVSFFLEPSEMSMERRRQLLTDALPSVAVDEETRTKAVLFMQEAGLRVRTFPNLKAMIDEGFLLDVRGYKLTLREKVLDAEIMAAAITLNEAINDNLARLAQADSPAKKELEAHLAEVDKSLKAMFEPTRENETATQARFEKGIGKNAPVRPLAPSTPRAPARKALAATRTGKPPPPRKAASESFFKRGVDSRFALFIVFVLATLGIRAIVNDDDATADTLGQADLVSISPMLLSGTVAPASRPSSFVGIIDPLQWRAMSGPERQAFAADFASKVSSKGWRAGTLAAGNDLAIFVEDGQVVEVH
ncbi:MAG: hypothetical protein JNG84_14060 [Archangium sp.]|nr:hypothetical protein [Archangium sp.]